MNVETRDRGACVVVVTDRDVSIDGKGNVQRIRSLCMALFTLDYRVVLLCKRPREQEWRPDWLQVEYSDAAGFVGGSIANCDVSSYASLTRALVKKWRPSVVVAEYAWMAPCLLNLGGVRVRAVDAHDVLHSRTTRFQALGQDPWIRCSATQERDLLCLADVVFAIQDNDRIELSSLLDSNRVVTIHHWVQRASGCHSPSTGSRLLFIGSSHTGNRGVVSFACEILPLLKACTPEVELEVVGSICKTVPLRPGVILRPYVTSLVEAYDRATIVIAPVEVGSGLKIKTVEALAHGRTVVALPEGVSGLPSPRKRAWLTVRSQYQMGAEIARLLRDAHDRHSIERAGIEFVAEHFSLQHVQTTLLNALAECT